MKNAATQPRTIPQPVLDARKSLDMLRAEGAAVAPELEKALPAYALNLSKTGQEVTVEGLLMAARQGAAFLKAISIEAPQPPKEDFLTAYTRIVSAFPKMGNREHEDTAEKNPYKGAQLRVQFFIACERGDVEKVRSFIKRDADVARRNNDVLAYAAMRGHLDVVRLLIEHGADVTVNNNEALVNAANGNLEVVKLLIKHGADVTARDNEAIICAAGWGRLEVVKLLIKHGADVTAQDNVGISYAVTRGYPDIASLLLEHGADINILSNGQKKALGHYRKGVKLWQKTVRMDPPKGLHSENPAFFKKTCFEAIVKMLAKEGYKGNEVNTMAFHSAGLFQSEQRVLQYLEQWGSAGKQPLHDLVQMIKLPKEGLPNLKDWGDAVLKCGPSMARLVKFGDKISSPMKSADGKTWSMVNTRAECAKHSFKKAAEHPALAALCFEHDVDEGDFNKALKLIQKTTPAEKTVPDMLIDGGRFGAEGARFYRLPSNDIRGLFLGEMTGCCQSIGGVGEDCAKHGYTSKDSGFYVVENAKGRIVAQTWAWRGEKGEMCFDSLETLGGNVTADQWKEILKEVAKELTTRKDHDVTALHVGTSGATPTDSLRQQFAKSATAMPKNYSGYRDSTEGQILVWKR